MNAVQEYRRAFRKALHCGSQLKKQLLRQLDDIASPFLEENAAPTLQELTKALGDPRQMAKTMLHEQPDDVLRRDRRRRVLWWVGVIVLVSTIVGLVVYLAKPQVIDLTVEETIIVYDEYEENEEPVAHDELDENAEEEVK